MITIRVNVDGREVATTTAKSRWELPEVISKATRSYEHDANLAFQSEEKVRDFRGDLTEVIVRYQSARMQKAA